MSNDYDSTNTLRGLETMLVSASLDLDNDATLPTPAVPWALSRKARNRL